MKKSLFFLVLLQASSMVGAENIYWQLYHYKNNYYGEVYNSREWCMQVGKQNGWKPDEYTCIMIKK